MIAEPLTTDPTEPRSFDELVKELDSILDVWFMAEVSRALEDAHEARLGRAELEQ